MQTHITGSGTDRRVKGRNNRPKYYLAVEILLLALVVFFVSFAKIKILTVASALAAVFFMIMSSIPRYRKMQARQTEKHTYNHQR